MARLRMGMVGGGPGSFIGNIHRIAAELDREIELVAGAFSSVPERCRQAADTYRIDPERSYPHWDAMFAAERDRGDGIDFVAVVTPNHLHLPISLAALAIGLPVVSDKPMTATAAEATTLAAAVNASGLPYRLTYTYSGYPLVREARELIRDGVIGTIRKVVVEYSQGWLAEPIERSGNRQAAWRTDPARAGEGGCIGDIGVHAFHLAEFVTGMRVASLSADLAAVVPGRLLDDDASVLLRFDNGARGVLLASQIALGDRNGLRIRVYGESGGIDWRQESPNVLVLNRDDGISEVRHAGAQTLRSAATTRLPVGHPEGYLEAFANIYRDVAQLLRGAVDDVLVPDAAEGLRGMRFVAASLASQALGAAWTDIG